MVSPEKQSDSAKNPVVEAVKAVPTEIGDSAASAGEAIVGSVKAVGQAVGHLIKRENYADDPELPKSIEQRPVKPQRALVFFNPNSGGAKDSDIGVASLLQRLEAVGIGADLAPYSEDRSQGDVAREAVEQGMELIIAAGGDGTIEEVAAGLVGSKAVLGVLPFGTRNNLARSLGVPMDLDDAFQLVAKGDRRPIDIGILRSGKDGEARYFLETATIGIGALAAPVGEGAQKGNWGTALQGLGDLMQFTGSSMRLECDDGVCHEFDAHLVTISNAPLVGPQAVLSPGTLMDDGLLNVTIYPEMSKGEIAAYLLAVAGGHAVPDAPVEHLQVRSLSIDQSDPNPASADMELMDEHTRWEVEVLPGAITVIAGHGVGLSGSEPQTGAVTAS